MSTTLRDRAEAFIDAAESEIAALERLKADLERQCKQHAERVQELSGANHRLTERLRELTNPQPTTPASGFVTYYGEKREAVAQTFYEEFTKRHPATLYLPWCNLNASAQEAIRQAGDVVARMIHNWERFPAPMPQIPTPPPGCAIGLGYFIPEGATIIKYDMVPSKESSFEFNFSGTFRFTGARR